MPTPRRHPGRFLAPNGRTRTKPLRELPTVADEPEQVDRIREARTFADEPEGLGPAILETYAQVNRRILTQQHVLEVAEAQERRPELTPQHRLDDVHRRAKHAHVDLSHEIHLVGKAIEKARMREQPVNPRAIERLTRLEALLDGVSIRSLAA
jgi:chromosome segregation ATPase